MTTAYAGNVQYGPGAQVTSGGKTYVNVAEHKVEGYAPPNDPWVEVGVAAGAQSVHIANAVADGALTGAAVATANGSDPATTQALANALKTAVNANTTDIAAMRTALNNLVGVVNTLLADLQSAGLMSAT